MEPDDTAEDHVDTAEHLGVAASDDAEDEFLAEAAPDHA